MLRSTGVKKDIRLSKKHVYSGYNKIDVKSYIGLNGDCYDRYLIRMFEMAESLSISNYVCSELLSMGNQNIGYQTLINKQITLKTNPYSSMEDLINHFIQ
jgi:NADH:ubiquinone oxidoreductase subunit D